MNCIPIKTRPVQTSQLALEQLIVESIDRLESGTIVAITSKVVSLCEGSVVARDDTDKDTLIRRYSQYYLPAEQSQYGHHFTISHNTLIASAGIDESNGDGGYILWPHDAQATANNIRRFLCEHYGVERIGVIITDSTCQPLRLGTTGIVLAHSGFSAIRNYIGQPDLFGRPFGVTRANIAGGLAASAVLVMGEGAECTPLCIMTGLDFVEFQDRDPSPQELTATRISPDEDLFAPFLGAVKWKKGQVDIREG